MEYPLAHLANVTLPVVGLHHSPMSQKFGLPRQSNLVDISSVIELLPPYDMQDAVLGLEGFSHLWLHWYFHANRELSAHSDSFRAKIRPPRLGGNDKVGVFASRSMYRPSQMGMSVVQLQGIEERQGRRLIHIMGTDLLDKTPILDIRPYIAYSDAITGSRSGYAQHRPDTCWVNVHKDARQQFDELVTQTASAGTDDWLSPLSEADWQIIVDLIAQDPRPAYRQKVDDRVYVMRYKNVDVQFVQTEQGALQMIKVAKVF